MSARVQPDCVGFDAFGRVISGTLKIGDQVKVLGEGYTLDDDEDMTVKTVTDIWLYQGRYACLCMCWACTDVIFVHA